MATHSCIGNPCKLCNGQIDPFWTMQYQNKPTPPNPWQQLLAAAKVVADHWTASNISLGPNSTAMVAVVKALDGASVPTMQALSPMTLDTHGSTTRFWAAYCSVCRDGLEGDKWTKKEADTFINQHNAMHATPSVPIAAVISESQKRLGLREARFVNKTAYDCDIDD